MAELTLEERVARLESEINQLKLSDHKKVKEAPRGWKRIVGVFADSPEFEEAVRYGREWREAQLPPDEESLA